MSSSHENIGSKWKSIPISLQEEAQVEIGGGGDGFNNNTQNHHQQQQMMMNPSCNTTTSDLFSMSDYEVAELTWENGQLVMHGLSGLFPSNSTKPITWSRPNDTLESIVVQATCQKESLNLPQDQEPGKDVLESPEKHNSMVGSSGGPGSETSRQVPKKRTRADSDQYERNFRGRILEERGGRKNVCGSASASATFCRENDTAMMTRASYESPTNFRGKTIDEDSACHGGSENQGKYHETKAETSRSPSSRRIRATAIHNQSERRRRERINEKMKALQKLVPNANKTDKASMLDEVIDYLKQLQAQVQMMNNVMNISTTHMNTMMPLSLAMQHHQHQHQHQHHHHHHHQQLLQMSMLLARMHGMGLAAGMAAAGMGMHSDVNNPSTMTAVAHGSGPQSHPLIHPSMAAAAATRVVDPHFMGRTLPPPPAVTNSTADLNSQQSMNIDLYNKMAALHRQSINRTTPLTSSPSATSKLNYD